MTGLGDVWKSRQVFPTQPSCFPLTLVELGEPPRPNETAFPCWTVPNVVITVRVYWYRHGNRPQEPLILPAARPEARSKHWTSWPNCGGAHPKGARRFGARSQKTPQVRVTPPRRRDGAPSFAKRTALFRKLWQVRTLPLLESGPGRPVQLMPYRGVEPRGYLRLNESDTMSPSCHGGALETTPCGQE
ncbi:hypothetical protein LZ31DRAFT_548714 [Colletotrichum somersetense]|nr:hypothetical protein LZ31DRAFT_548714 [Colletotrichum somersetense]